MMKSLHLRIIYLAFLYFVPLYGALATTVGYKAKFHKLSEIVANCILDSNSIIVVAEKRNDSNMLDPEEKFPTQGIKPDVRMAFGMYEFFPLVYLRGKGNENSINVQLNMWEIIRNRGKPFQYIPNFSEEGTWLLFLKPVKNLPDTFEKPHNQVLQKKLESIDNKMPPHDAARQLGIHGWLREDNWFALAEPMSAVLINFNLRDLKSPHSYSDSFIQNQARMRDILRKKREQARAKLNRIVLTPEQFEQIKSLIAMFDSENGLPSVEQLISLNSPFSNAILEELAQRSLDELGDRFKQLKDEISESFSGSSH